ncbi:uncharacterized protein ASCRUDRAFT_141095, partial [Ascoidea rubescens DSM 1968]
MRPGEIFPRRPLNFAISGAPCIKGKKKFPAQPIKLGITKKKIIKTPCPEISSENN